MSLILSTANNSTLANVSSGMAIQNGFANSFGLVGPVLLVVFATLVIGLFIGMLQSLKVYDRIWRVIESFGRSVEYALKGVVTAVVIGLIVGPIYFISQMDSQTQGMVAQAIGLVIAGYVGLVALGYLGDKVWQRIVSQHEDATGHKPFENWGEASDD